MLLAGCELKSFEVADGETGDGCEDGCEPVAGELCQVSGCDVVGGRLACEVTMMLPEGSDGDFAIVSSGFGDVPWNELPWNAEAGDLENAEIAGPVICGEASIITASVTPNAEGERYVHLVCADYTLGGYTSFRYDL